MRSAFRLGSSFVVAFALAWCGAASAADNMTSADTSPQDILSKIHTVNQNEIKMSKLALQKAQSKEVKQYAQRMIKDHTMADQKVTKLAKQENITLGQVPMTAQQQGQWDQLASASGAEFDRLYMEANRTGHAMAVDMLKNAQAQTTDPKVKNLVTQLMPTVQHHEHLATEISPSNAKTSS